MPQGNILRIKKKLSVTQTVFSKSVEFIYISSIKYVCKFSNCFNIYFLAHKLWYCKLRKSNF